MTQYYNQDGFGQFIESDDLSDAHCEGYKAILGSGGTCPDLSKITTRRLTEQERYDMIRPETRERWKQEELEAMKEDYK
jgi:hypothetical protein